MGMRRRGSAAQAIEIPMSSMIDVVFLLLIYFIVTYKEEIPEAHLAVNLPSPTEPPTEPVAPPTLLEIEVQPGEYRLQKKTLTLGTIMKTLRSLAETDPDLTVIVQVSQRAKTKNLVTILDICKGVGLSNLNVVTLE